MTYGGMCINHLQTGNKQQANEVITSPPLITIVGQQRSVPPTPKCETHVLLTIDHACAFSLM